MKRLLLPLLCCCILVFGASARLTARANADASDATPQSNIDAGAEAASTSTSGTSSSTSTASAPNDERQTSDKVVATEAAAAVTAAKIVQRQTRRPDLLEHLVDSVLELFDVRSSGNTVAHYVVSMLFLVMALLARRIVTGVVFAGLKKLSAKTRTTLDDKLYPALEAPAATFIMVTGIFAALKVLKLPEDTDALIDEASTVAYALVIFWGLWRALDAVLDHAHEVAATKQLSVAGFMPWIKKTVFSAFVIVGGLLTLKSMGFHVETWLAGLGIGGLAFALAAQDTLANVFGSVVVAVDQPFKVGEFVKIGSNIGMIEDIGLRSTRIRLLDKSLMVMPNKTVASESIQNFSRFTGRRFEQVIGLTYDTKPEQMEEMVTEIRRLIYSEPGVKPNSALVYFRDFADSSLGIWVVYEAGEPDFIKAMEMHQRLNLAFMQAVAARGLSFAFPTQTIQLDGPIARQLAGGKS